MYTKEEWEEHYAATPIVRRWIRFFKNLITIKISMLRWKRNV
jgi:hypothetical protein